MIRDLAARLRRRHDDSPPPAPDELGRARRRNRRLRRRLDNVSASLARAQLELDVLRAFTLDVFPGVELPERVQRTVASVVDERLTYLPVPYLSSLASCVVEAERSGRPGMLIEAGTALGGSAIAMAAAKDPDRPLRVYDVFGLIPPPGERDGADVQHRYDDIRAGRASGPGGEEYYGYRADLLSEVRASFERHGLPVSAHHVELVRGLFEDTLHVDGPVALAHVDCDWYDSTMVCLERIAPHVVPGGRIVVDDYFMWSGCRQAVDEFFAERTDFRLERRAKVHAVRLPDADRGMPDPSR